MIRDRGLYKSERLEPVAGRYSFTTFEEYVSERWEMQGNRAHHIIQSAEAASKLCEIEHNFPARESHVRELLKLEGDDDRATVWRALLKI